MKNDNLSNGSNVPSIWHNVLRVLTSNNEGNLNVYKDSSQFYTKNLKGRWYYSKNKSWQYPTLHSAVDINNRLNNWCAWDSNADVCADSDAEQYCTVRSGRADATAEGADDWASLSRASPTKRRASGSKTVSHGKTVASFFFSLYTLYTTHSSLRHIAPFEQKKRVLCVV